MLSVELEVGFEVKPLPYDYDELQPAISSKTLEFHYGAHYEGYISNLNRLIDGTPKGEMTLEEVVRRSDGAIFNNASQAWNHEFYFDQFSSNPKLEPEGELLDAIEHSFGTFDHFIELFKVEAARLFGSGWLWLSEDDMSNLIIESDSNAGTPLARNLRPLLTIDLWEHAYYLDYQNRRGEAVDAHLKLVDWSVVECRYRR